MIPDTVTTLRASNNFVVTPVDCMSLPGHMFETLATVKVEPEDIKEEVVEFDNSSLFESVKIEGTYFISCKFSLNLIAFCFLA